LKHLVSLLPFFRKYHFRLLLGLLFVVATNYFRMVSPKITGLVIDVVVNRTSGNSSLPVQEQNGWISRSLSRWFAESSSGEIVFRTGLLLLALALISGFFMFMMRQTIIVMSRLIEYDQKNQVFAHYQQLDSAFFKVNRTGDLMNRISEDISRVRMFTGPALMYFINLAAVLCFSIYFMYTTNPKLTLASLSPLPLLAIAIYRVNNIVNRKTERIQALLSDLTTNAQESYSGIRVIKSFVQEKAMMRFFDDNSERYRKEAISLARTEAFYFPSMALLIGISTIITITLGALDVVHGVPGASVGTIAEFVLYIQLLTFPVSAIGWTASMTQRAATSQQRINEFLHTIPAITSPEGAARPDLRGEISIHDLSFTYPHTGIRAVKNFSLTIPAGSRLALVGRTGSGKTAFAQLLLRFYDADSGSISFDGTPIRQIDPAHLRRNISYVPQDNFLFSDTVYNNVAFGADSPEAGAVEAACRMACIHEEVMRLPMGYQTTIGERGVTLSGGQKQRLSIARAILRNAPVVVLDDCLSAVDARTEQTILSNLETFLSGKTAIIITHRIFTLLSFDQIAVIEEGRIAELGTHDLLMQAGGQYRSMFLRQQEQTGETT
jgi:ATP-binding cassette subfamily B protein